MTKTILIPENNNYNLSIPEEYIGKQIEILIYSLDEVAEEKKIKSKKTMADFWGTISDETANELHRHVEEGRLEWEERLKKQF